MSDYSHILTYLTLNPMLIAQDKFEQIFNMLENGGDPNHPDVVNAVDSKAFHEGLLMQGAAATSYGSTMNQKGIIHVQGVLVHRHALLRNSSGLTSYKQIQADALAAASDRQNKELIVVMHTPGGDVYGAFEARETFARIAAEKPVTFLVNDLAASAGYLLASAGTSIVSSSTADVGSIGVAMAHVDRSEEEAKAGRKWTFITAGNGKRDITDKAPLSKEATAMLQARADSIYNEFVEVAATGRDMPEEAIRELGALTYRAPDALEAGLIDEIVNTTDFLTSRSEAASVSVPIGEPKVKTTSTAEVPAVEGGVTGEASTSPAQPTPVAGPSAKDERARIQTILSSDEAKGRAKLAEHIAYSTDMGATDAIAMLGAAEKESMDTLGTHMSEDSNPDIGEDVQTMDQEAPDVVLDQDSYYDRRQACVAKAQGN